MTRAHKPALIPPVLDCVHKLHEKWQFHMSLQSTGVLEYLIDPYSISIVGILDNIKPQDNRVQCLPIP